VEISLATYTRSGQFTVGQWTVTPALDRLKRGGKTVTIEPSAMAVLVYLARHANQVIAAEEFTKNLWRKKVVGDDAIYQRIHRLRTVLEDHPQGARYIETIPRKGYRLIAPVKFLDDQSTEIRPDKRRRAIASALLVATILLGVSYLATRPPDDGGSHPALIQQAAAANSIAVLPFVDLSDVQDQKHLGDGISEELIHTLSNIAGLRVAARTSTFRIAQTDADIRTIGERLNVAQVLEGSVRRQGDQLRITAQLVNAADGYHLWTKTYDRDVTDLLRIQQEIAVAVAESFAATLTIDTAYTQNQAAITDVDAYGYYLLGCHHLRTATTPDLDRAMTYFRRAIELDPDFSRAYSGLASAYLLRPRWGDRNENQILTIARTAIEQALPIDAQEAEAHAALGMLRRRNGDNAGAIAAF
jgi:TolB-like protein/DNA-binding winged helix-turn-helix (wHTH) protein